MYAHSSRSSSEVPAYARSHQFETIPVQLPRITVDEPEKPKKEEYAIFVSAVYEMYNQDPKAWWKQERRYLSGIGSHFSGNNRPRVQKTSAPAPKPRAIAPAPRPASGSGLAAPKPRPRTQRTPRATPKVLALDSYDASLLTPPNFKLSSKPKAPVSREDVDFESIPDYCPPLSTLPPNNNKCLKTEWKGQALNLDNDPHRHLLHPAEIQLAATLRLSCASYLTSKRRIFQEKVHRTQNGMEFRKTDSQKACKIDVNKASKLWASFDKVGWFDIKYIKQYL
ncbi:hypothetical protein BJ508DRAFT_212506 [Ascobolus immersus RN42]|uniref:SWIRM domain-containing protein n=1 Tax=Ascobolus immersus RN42 TaxID=1160509 RepID=A0A3N4HVY9_ASCIM|nr:hypothetical protein BJ508DRAFT_212506 [Ascobolus immersus RN42]